MVILAFLAFGLLSPLNGKISSVIKKVTEESKQITIAAEVLNTASKQTAELLGISQLAAKQQIVGAINTASKETAEQLDISEELAKKQIVEALSSKNGLDKKGELLSPSTAFCCSDHLLSRFASTQTCSLQQFVPIHPAGFPHHGSQRIPFPFCSGPSSPDCLGIFANCNEECPICNKCDKYRTIDGKCNNLSECDCNGVTSCPRNWGSRNQALRRLIENNYEGMVINLSE